MLQYQDKPIPHRPCKFVKVAGRYRFFPRNKWDAHRDAVGPAETAEAAGSLIEYDDRWVLMDGYSTSLKVGCQETHCREIDALLGKPEQTE